MKTSIRLNEADEQRLHLLLHHDSAPPTPDDAQRKTLRRLLKHSGEASGEDDADHVGFHDRVILASPEDPRDNFTFRISMPREADVDDDRISILTPISLAVLGRRAGDIVEWATPLAKRRMRVVSILKHDVPELVTS